MVKEAISNKTEQAVIQFLESKVKLFKRIDIEIMNELLAEKYDLSINEIKQIINNSNSIQNAITECPTHYNLKSESILPIIKQLIN